MNHENNEIIFNSYKKSKIIRMRISWYYFRRDTIAYFTINVMFAVVLAFLNFYQHFILFLITILFAGLYVYLKVNIIEKKINTILIQQKGYQKFNYKSLNHLLGAKALEVVYFQYLLSKEQVKFEDLVNYYRTIKFKTKGYVRITEKGIFSAFISLVTSVTVSLSIVAVTLEQKLPFETIVIITLVFTSIIAFFIFFIYQTFPILERKITEEENIKDILEFIIKQKNNKI